MSMSAAVLPSTYPVPPARPISGRSAIAVPFRRRSARSSQQTRRRRYPQLDCSRRRQGPLSTGLRCACVVDEVAELVAAGDAELGVGAVQVRGDGAGGQEQAVGDLAVGQAVSGEDGDLALLRGEPVQ